MGWGTPHGWIEPDARAENRCLVTGVYRTAGGAGVNRTVTFTPEHGGVWRGEFVAGDAVGTLPGDDGRFGAALVPSEAVGRYAVRMGDHRVTIDVPDRATADLVAIVVEEETGG